jgi:MFS family permease
VYLYTGSKRSFAPLGVFYAILFMATIALIEKVGSPERIVDNGWSIRTEPQVEFGLAFNLGFTLLIIGPQMLAAIAYARLYRKTDDRTQKYRIAMVTGSILLWFGSSVVAAALELSQDVAWQLASRLIGIVGALGILVAYKPPRWLRDKYGIRSIKDEAPATVAEVPA